MRLGFYIIKMLSKFLPYNFSMVDKIFMYRKFVPCINMHTGIFALKYSLDFQHKSPNI